MTLLKYGNTNTFLIHSRLLIDTDYAGTLRAFHRALKGANVGAAYMMSTHYHPDHCGLTGQLQKQGVKLVVWESQVDYIHFSDYIFERDAVPFIPVDLSAALILSFEESRRFLEGLGINGEVVPTPSHSPDSVSLLLDNGDCFAGDLMRREWTEPGTAAYEDWQKLTGAKMIYYGHGPVSGR